MPKYSDDKNPWYKYLDKKIASLTSQELARVEFAALCYKEGYEACAKESEFTEEEEKYLDIILERSYEYMPVWTKSRWDRIIDSIRKKVLGE